MDTTRFCNDLDNQLANRTPEELKNYLKWLLEHTSIDGRKEFIRQFSCSAREKNWPFETSAGTGTAVVTDCSDLTRKVNLITGKLSKLLQEHRQLVISYEEGWEELCEDYTEDFEFYDETGIIPDVKEALELLLKCSQVKNFPLARRMTDLLVDLRIPFAGDYNHIEFRLDDVFQNSLIPSSEQLNETLVYAAFLLSNYMIEDQNVRMEQLYRLVQKLKINEINFDSMKSLYGAELPDLNEFLALWIDFLVAKHREKDPFTESNQFSSLLSNSLIMQSFDNASASAKKHVKHYPQLFSAIFNKRWYDTTTEKLYNLTLEALNEAEPGVHKAEYAMKAASLAIELHKPEKLADFYMEAFRASPTMVNYLRLKSSIEPSDRTAADRLSSLVSELNRIKSAEGSEFQQSQWEQVYTQILAFEGRIGELIPYLNQHSYTPPGTILLLLFAVSDGTFLEKSADSEMLTKTIQEAVFFEADKFINGTEAWKYSCNRYQYNVPWYGMEETRELLRNVLFKAKNNVTVSAENSRLIITQLNSLIENYTDHLTCNLRRSEYGLGAALIYEYCRLLSAVHPDSDDSVKCLTYYLSEFSRWRSLVEQIRSRVRDN